MNWHRKTASQEPPRLVATESEVELLKQRAASAGTAADAALCDEIRPELVDVSGRDFTPEYMDRLSPRERVMLRHLVAIRDIVARHDAKREGSTT